MAQLNDAYADIPIADRIAMFESHIKPFGADNHQRIDFGYKYEPKPPKKMSVINPHIAKDRLRAKVPAADIREPLNLYNKMKQNPSVRPEYNDTYMKPFAASAKGVTNHDLQHSPGKPTPSPQRKSIVSSIRPKSAARTCKTKKKKHIRRARDSSALFSPPDHSESLMPFDVNQSGKISNIEMRQNDSEIFEF